VTTFSPQCFTVAVGESKTLLSSLRAWLPGHSWSALRKLLQARRVTVNHVLCLDEARRLTEGEVVAITARPLPEPPTDKDVVIRFVDPQLVVVEKPSGMLTLRPAVERHWSPQRRHRQPALDEALSRLLAGQQRGRQQLPRLWPVHRIDRDTSGLLVFARSELTQRHLIRQFAQHDTVRRYLAIIPGRIVDQTVRTYLVRDRGDGLRGSSADSQSGQLAITHLRVLQHRYGYSELECRLETGRTNQIRIHLAELRHPICGDIRYRGPFGKPPIPDTSASPRLALHAAQLSFVHPVSGEQQQFDSCWPRDMRVYLQRTGLLHG
jgi:23S rRNA pseudouridine1911/1915/1917 synthase